MLLLGGRPEFDAGVAWDLLVVGLLVFDHALDVGLDDGVEADLPQGSHAADVLDDEPVSYTHLTLPTSDLV